MYPGFLDERERHRANVLRLKESFHDVAFAGSVGISEVVFLSTWIPWIGVDFYDEGWLTQSIRFWQEILEGSPSGAQVLFCNTFDPSPEMMQRLLEGVGSPRFQGAFDVGHALAWGKCPWQEWASLQPRVAFLHSNDGARDLHLSIREGRLPQEDGAWQLVLELAERGTIVLLQPFDKSVLEQDALHYLARNALASFNPA